MTRGWLGVLVAAALLFAVGATCKGSSSSTIDPLVALRGPGAPPVGVVVVDGHEVRIETADWRNGGGDPLDERAHFEIGSIAKVFAGVLLADSELPLDAPVARLLPDWTIPSGPRGTPIRLRHLATHHSGLPLFPSNWTPVDWTRARTTYTEALLREELRATTLATEPGSAHRYSSVGTSLLALALAAHAETTYGALLTSRLAEPLGMDDTFLADRRTDPRDFLSATDHEGRPVDARRVDDSPMAPCCAVVSTLPDMGRFLVAILAAADGRRDGPLDVALAATLMDHEGADVAPAAGLGWEVGRRPGTFERSGQVDGYRAMLVIDPDRRWGAFLVVGSMRAPIHEMTDALLDAERASP